MNNIIEQNAGKNFKPVISSIEYDQLKKYYNNGISIGVNNAFIISMPTNNNNIKIDECSIWISDKLGKIYPITYPLKELATYSLATVNNEVQSILQEFINNEVQSILQESVYNILNSKIIYVDTEYPVNADNEDDEETENAYKIHSDTHRYYYTGKTINMKHTYEDNDTEYECYVWKLLSCDDMYSAKTYLLTTTIDINELKNQVSTKNSIQEFSAFFSYLTTDGNYYMPDDGKTREILLKASENIFEDFQTNI